MGMIIGRVMSDFKKVLRKRKDAKLEKQESDCNSSIRKHKRLAKTRRKLSKR